MRLETALVAGTAVLCLACGGIFGGEPELPPELPEIDLVAEPEPEPEIAGPCCCEVDEGVYEDVEACASGICVDESHCATAETAVIDEPDEPDEPAAATTTTTDVGGHMTRPGTTTSGTRASTTRGTASRPGAMTRPGTTSTKSSSTSSSTSSDDESSSSSRSGTMKRPSR